MTVSPPALHALRDQFLTAVRTGTVSDVESARPATWTADYPLWRFLNHLRARPVVTLDHGVLLRQAVRWSQDRLFVGTVQPAFHAVMASCGVALNGAGDLVTEAYRPDWLMGDDRPIDEPPSLAIPEERLPAEPWLWSLAEGEMREWHSPAQKEACWQALTARPGSTCLIGLPTGAGKSLTFQLAARFSAGVTIVIVPTTALAIDQCLSAREILKDFPHLGPRYYASNDPTNDPASVREALRDGSCRLLFASPEACVSGSLRTLIEELASAGRLDRLVVDEAHIIDSWGGHFRVEFQLLAIRRRQWLEMSGGRLRTLLLSATFTPYCLDLLRNMFGDDDWNQFACQRLRPEISYFRQGFEGQTLRDAALLEALHHLPRPLIVYVTKVDDAIRLQEAIKAEGFAATECFHGDTVGLDRRRLLAAWRTDQIEIMVATSAFGMGVDKADVRAVVHACFPESVHRYYQEVGRGGRDGAGSVALWMPATKADKAVAMGLLPKLLGRDLIELRWKSLLDAATDGPDGVLSITTNVKHERLIGGRSYGENIRWNKRLLLMMARADLIDLKDLQYEEEPSEPGVWVERVLLTTRFPPADGRVADRLEAPRSRDLDEAARGAVALDAYLAGDAKICRLLRREYGADTIVACGGCVGCRDQVRDRYSVPTLDFDPPPATDPKLEVVAAPHFSNGAKAVSDLAGRVADLVREHGLSHFIVASALRDDLTKALATRLRPNDRYLYRIDDARDARRLLVGADSHVIALHGRAPDRDLLRLRVGARLSHLFPRDAHLADANDRILLVHDGADYFPTYDNWVARL